MGRKLFAASALSKWWWSFKFSQHRRSHRCRQSLSVPPLPISMARSLRLGSVKPSHMYLDPSFLLLLSKSTLLQNSFCKSHCHFHWIERANLSNGLFPSWKQKSYDYQLLAQLLSLHRIDIFSFISFDSCGGYWYWLDSWRTLSLCIRVTTIQLLAHQPSKHQLFTVSIGVTFTAIHSDDYIYESLWMKLAKIILDSHTILLSLSYEMLLRRSGLPRQFHSNKCSQ